MSLNTCMIPSGEEINVYQLIAKNAASTPYWNKLGGEQGVLSIMLLARELGISPMNAISGMLHPIQGKVELSAKGITYLIRRAGHRIKLVLLTPTKCTLKGIRNDTQEEMEISYTIEDARTAGLVRKGGGWVNNPKDMLFARTISRLGRWLFTDCLGTCYVEGELQETIGKKIPSSPVMDLEEIEVEEIDLERPSDVSQEQVDAYLTYLTEQYDKPPNDFLHEAKKRPEAFFEKVRSFSEDKDVSVSPEED